MTQEWVVDASVAIKLFVDEDLSDRSADLFNRLEGSLPFRFYVPDLFYLECANILWKYVRRFGHSAEQARSDLEALGSLALQPVACSELSEDSLDLALSLDISAYDASYAALARALPAPLITADRKLIRKLEGNGIMVRWLGEPRLL